MKQKELSRWLKAILVLAVVAGLVTLLVLVPSFGRSTVLTYPEYAFLYWPCLLFIWLSGVPLFAAIGYAWRVCSELARDNSFTAENARRAGSGRLSPARRQPSLRSCCSAAPHAYCS